MGDSGRLSPRCYLGIGMQALVRRPGERMLRISIDESEESVVLRLEGHLIAPWVAEVEQCWRRAFSDLRGRYAEVDLSAVNFVDTAGESLLARMYEAGFRVAGASTVSLLNALQAADHSERH
jgi:ABC-type transporter Mla MlaB component